MGGSTWTAIGSLLFAAALGFSFVVGGRRRWSTLTRSLEQRLDAAALPPDPARYDEARELAGLPAPVQRYFRTALTPGQPMVAAASIEHRGRFNLGTQRDRWLPFTSRQRVVTRRPGFVWDGRVTLLPGLDVHVHDAYVVGKGLLRPAVAGWLPLGDVQGGGDIARDELMRFLAEAAWYPTALLPSQGVRWEPVDDRTARATLSDGDVSAALTFAFADDGSIASVHAASRGRTVGGRSVPTPWEGRWSDLRTVDGMRLPMGGEVAWLLPEGRKPYWRGRITALHHEMAG